MEKKSTSYRLKGHEKFALRDGWLNKGLQVITDNPRIFLGDDGPDIFGVGNNMVKSIRYWMKACNLIEETLGKGAKLSKMGELILKYDPYFEDLTTLWLLHSNLVKNSLNATTWYLFFNKCDVEEFIKEEIVSLLQRELEKHIGSSNYSENSLKDDIDVLLNMYCKEKTANYDPEDKNICPLSVLGLIKKRREIYCKVQPDKSKLSEWVVLYELICMFGIDKTDISIENIAIGDNGISNIYNLGRVTVNEYLDRLEHMQYIHVDRTAGLDMVYLTEKLKPLEVMEEYYKTHR